jgi:hypothetical protein
MVDVMRNLAVTIVLLSLSFVVGGCQPIKTTSGTNSGGVTTMHSEWRTVPIRKASINIGDLIDEPIESVRQRFTNNNKEDLNIKFKDSRGRFYSQHMLTGWYAQSARDRLKSLPDFETWVRKRVGNGFSELENIRRLGGHSNTQPDGYKAIAILTNGNKCAVARWGARIAEQSSYSDDEGLFDIWVTAHYCAPTVKVTYFDTMISDLDVK